MDRLTTPKLLAIIIFAAVLSTPLAAVAADQAAASTSPLVTPRLVSAIGGGSIKPGAPRPTPSFSLADATGGGPAFPTRPVHSRAAPASVTVRDAPTAFSAWSTAVIASIAFVVGAGLATTIARRRRDAPPMPV